VSIWQEIKLVFTNGFMHLPAILKMKYYVNRKFGKVAFSRANVLKRDKYICQYCQKSMTSLEAEVDHIVPRKHGGKSTFENCVAACRPCNGKKGSRRLEDTDLKLIRQPTIPNGQLHYVAKADGWHETWSNFLNA
jgi:5-methylcytosine-specific restriction endonuclease McrA